MCSLADSLGDMRQRFIDLVDEDQAEVSGAQLGERRVDGQELAAHFLDVFCPPGVLSTLAQQGEYFAVRASSLALILIEHDTVESLAEDLGLLADVFVAPVSGAADDH